MWTDPHLPLTVITGFCRGLRLSSTYHPSGAAELAALAQPLRKAVLRQVEEWDPQAVGSKGPDSSSWVVRCVGAEAENWEQRILQSSFGLACEPRNIEGLLG